MTLPLPSESERDARDRQWLSQIASGGAQAGDATNVLFMAYRAEFLVALRKRGLVGDRAEDVISDLFFDLVTKPPECPADVVPRFWLLKVLDNRFKGYRRREDDEQRRRDRYSELGLHGRDDAPGRTPPTANAPAHDHLSAWVPGPEQGPSRLDLLRCLERLQAEDPESMELVEAVCLDVHFKTEHAAAWRYERCRLRDCKRATCAPTECPAGTLSATEKALTRARNKFKGLLSDFGFL